MHRYSWNIFQIYSDSGLFCRSLKSWISEHPPPVPSASDKPLKGPLLAMTNCSLVPFYLLNLYQCSILLVWSVIEVKYTLLPQRMLQIRRFTYLIISTKQLLNHWNDLRPQKLDSWSMFKSSEMKLLCVQTELLIQFLTDYFVLKKVKDLAFGRREILGDEAA